MFLTTGYTASIILHHPPATKQLIPGYRVFLKSSDIARSPKKHRTMPHGYLHSRTAIVRIITLIYYRRMKSITRLACRLSKILLTGCGWLLMLILLLVAWNLKDPHLLPYREYETAALLLLSVGGLFICLRQLRGIPRLLGMGLMAATLLLTMYGEGSFRYHKDLVLNHDLRAAQQLGQHFIVGYTTPDEIAPLARKGLIGGIFITRRNSQGKNAEQIRREIADLQTLRHAAGLPPLIITTDQEGGIVSRLSPPLTRMPPLASLIVGGKDRAQILADAETYGQEQGRELAALGVTVNFSPVVDLKIDHGKNALDFHSLISRRAISSDPALSADVAAAYARGLRSQGVHATYKHFPGLGRVAEDTHHFSARLDTPVATLTNSDWLPYRQIAGNDALLMIGHIVLTQIDDQLPASFSKAVVQNIIRQGWQHNGVLITDDLTMNAAYSHGLCNAVLKSLNAGVDLQLIAYDYEKIYDVLYCVNQAAERGQIDKQMLALSQTRLAGLTRSQISTPR